MKASAKISPQERVNLCVKKFDLDPRRVKTALRRIARRLYEHRIRALAQSKVERAKIKRFEAAVREFKAAHTALPEPLKQLIRHQISMDQLDQMIFMCACFRETPRGKPRRTDAYPKQVAAREAWRILGGGTKVTPELVELASILNGTGDPSDISRACRSVIEREASRPKAQSREEAEARVRAIIQVARQEGAIRESLLAHYVPQAPQIR